MIAVGLSALLWFSAPTGAAGEVLISGSIEDCLAWSMADLAAAGDDARAHQGAQVSRLMSEHFNDMLGRGAPSQEIIRRQRVLLRITETRRAAGGGQAARAVCEKNFPTPMRRPD